MASKGEEVYEKLHPVLELMVEIMCTNIEESMKLPEVSLVEGLDEELFINGISVCAHKNLYPSDILEALDEYGLIDFKREDDS